ncbi:MAG TPA: class I SAM-dependent methyltransferase [Bryobacteraceae bacterium]|nr:class I SAM-dependent methyltransferase [Bryobacteraceae bacterium]
MNCDRIARWYRYGEYLTLGRALERRRREYLSETDEAKHVLILGDGDGRFTAEFLKWNRTARVDSIDLSKNMLQLASRRIAALPFETQAVRLRHADALTTPFESKYDLIFTHFFLDCLSNAQIQELASRISHAATPDAKWIVSEFQTPNLAAALFVRALYFAFHLLTGSTVQRLPAYSSALTSNGFARIACKTALGGILISEFWKRT